MNANAKGRTGFLGGLPNRLRERAQGEKLKPVVPKRTYSQLSPKDSPPPEISGFQIRLLGEVVAIINLSYEAKFHGSADREIRVRVRWSNCGLPTTVFIPLLLVERYSPAQFHPNSKLEAAFQQDQRDLHVFLYHTLDQLRLIKYRFQEVYDEQLQSKLRQLEKRFAHQ